jgi:hypothetical protein
LLFFYFAELNVIFFLVLPVCSPNNKIISSLRHCKANIALQQGVFHIRTHYADSDQTKIQMRIRIREGNLARITMRILIRIQAAPEH